MSSGLQTDLAALATTSSSPSAAARAPASEPSIERLVSNLVPRRPRAEPAERLAKSLRSIISAAGYQTPGQAERAAAREAEQTADERRRRARALRDECGVFERYRGAELDDVEYPRRRLSADEFGRYVAVRDVLATLIDIPGIVVLSGDNGPGKSHLASALVHAACAAGTRARYVRASDFFLELKSTFNADGRTQLDLVRRFEKYSLLAVDEIEVRSDSNWENVVLRSLIDARYASCVSTVLITNKTKAELNGADGSTPYLSRALRDRIRHEGGILECTWRSLRGEAGR